MKKSMKALEKIGNTVAFFGQEFSVEKLVEDKKQQIKEAQMLDFRSEATVLPDIDKS